MQRTLRPFAVTGLALALIGMAENILFGRDTPGTAHDLSIVFFFVFLAGVVTLIGTGIVALVRAIRRGADRQPSNSPQR